MELKALHQNFFEQFSSGTMVPHWKNRYKDAQKNLDAFLSVGWPTRKQEDWKYSNISDWSERSFIAPTWDRSTLEVEPWCKNYIVIEDGHFREDLSSLNGMTCEVSIRALRAEKSLLSDDNPKLFQDVKKDAIYDLNSAFALDGVICKFGKVSSAPDTVEILHVLSDGVLSSSRVHLKFDRLSQVSVIERFVSKNSAGCSANSVTEIFCESGALVDYTVVQDLAADSFFYHCLSSQQNNDSGLNANTISVGAGFARFNVHMRLLGTGGRADLGHLYLTEKNQVADHCTVIDHLEPHCESSQLAKGILTDSSRGIFNGVIKVRQEAQKTDSSQLNKNLILSPKAEADTRPQLQIDADDVKAAHGATVGQLDEEEVFYLQSRGISRERAIEMLTLGFAEDVLFRVGSLEVRGQLSNLVEKKLKSFDFQKMEPSN